MTDRTAGTPPRFSAPSRVRPFGVGVAAMLVIGMAASAGARDQYVDARNGSDATGNGGRLRPWKRVTRGLAEATAGDHVYVAAGLYDWSRNGESFPLFVPQGVSLHGAAKGGTVIRDDRPLALGESVVRVIADHIGFDWVIERLHVQASTFRPGVAGVEITSRDGTGPTFRHSWVSGFDVGVRIGVRYPECAVLSSESVIDGNYLTGNGTGVEIDVDLAAGCGGPWPSERSRIVNNLMVGNRVGLWSRASAATDQVWLSTGIWNNTIVESLEDAIRIEQGDCVLAHNNPEIVNNLLAYNGGPVVSPGCGAIPSIRRNDFWQNGAGPGAAARARGRDDSGTLGTNMNVDPLFVDAEAGDYRLRLDSPLVDVAEEPALPLADLDGDQRPMDGDRDGRPQSDIGADELRDGPSL